MDDVRIGLFICQCGQEIASALDMDELLDEAAAIEGVVLAQSAPYPCSKDGIATIGVAIKEHRLNCLIVAGCSPRLMETHFGAALESFGLNRFLFEMANIREQCAWVHRSQSRNATEKAKELIRMAAAKVALNVPIDGARAGIEQRALVIGAGIAGMTAALSLAHRGHRVVVVEKEGEPGGAARNLCALYDAKTDIAEMIAAKTNELVQNPNIELFLNSTVKELKGHPGNYEAIISKSDGAAQDGDHVMRRAVGAIIVATGAKVMNARDLCPNGYNVITQYDFEKLLKAGLPSIPSLVMIQCVGSRCQERPYCSRLCCMTALKQAIMVKEANPATEVSIIFRDFQLQCEKEFRKAKSLGVVFLRYAPERPPEVNSRRVVIYDQLKGQHRSLRYDLIVLATPIIPREDAETVAKTLGLPLDENRFFIETDVKLRNSESAATGIFVAGAAHWPASIKESVYQGYSAASRATAFLEKRYISAQTCTVAIDEEMCRGCGRCARSCEFNAIDMLEDGAGMLKARLKEIACKGCGVCAAQCISGAITARNYTNEQIDAMLAAAQAPRESLMKVATHTMAHLEDNGDVLF